MKLPNVGFELSSTIPIVIPGFDGFPEVLFVSRVEVMIPSSAQEVSVASNLIQPAGVITRGEMAQSITPVPLPPPEILIIWLDPHGSYVPTDVPSCLIVSLALQLLPPPLLNGAFVQSTERSTSPSLKSLFPPLANLTV